MLNNGRVSRSRRGRRAVPTASHLRLSDHPQTHIVEGLGEIVKAGELANCEFINVESEFAALSVAIGASAAGARTYTATSSQGLLFMAEAVYNAAGTGTTDRDDDR